MAQNAEPVFGEPRAGDPRVIALIAIVLTACGVVLAYLLYEIWPAVAHATSPDPERQTITLFDGRLTFKPATDSVLILLVILAGALGAFIHAMTSLVGYVGARAFASSWYWWYAARLPIGAGLALLVYFALRGGVIGDDTSSDNVNPYGIAAIAALAGLFSRQAVEKLAEVFDTFFRTRGQAAADEASGVVPLPQLASIAPRSFAAGQAQDVTLTGGGFTDASTVMIAAAVGAALLKKPNLPVTETAMTVSVGAGELPAGDYEVRVANPPPGGGVSADQLLVVT
jgi:hypothetical protein